MASVQHAFRVDSAEEVRAMHTYLENGGQSRVIFSLHFVTSLKQKEPTPPSHCEGFWNVVSPAFLCRSTFFQCPYLGGCVRLIAFYHTLTSFTEWVFVSRNLYRDI